MRVARLEVASPRPDGRPRAARRARRRRSRQGKGRAHYGREIIKSLSKRLMEQYGRGFESTNLYWFLRFYRGYPNILDFRSQESGRLLSWSHYRELLKAEDAEARKWYEREARREAWNAKTLRRNIASQYYYRLLKSQVKQPVVDEMHELTAGLQSERLEFVKNPVIAEFRAFAQWAQYG